MFEQLLKDVYINIRNLCWFVTIVSINHSIYFVHVSVSEVNGISVMPLSDNYGLHSSLWAGQLSRYSDWLRVGRSGNRISFGGEIFRTCPDRPWGPPSLLQNGYRVFPKGKKRLGRDADPSPPSSVVVMKEQSYTSTFLMGCTACTEPQCLFKGALYLTLHSSLIGKTTLLRGVFFWYPVQRQLVVFHRIACTAGQNANTHTFPYTFLTAYLSVAHILLVVLRP